MKSIYDDLLEREFRTDSEGQIIFFAKGLTKPGYVLINEQKKSEIKKIISKYCSLLLTIWLLGFIIKKSLPSFLIMVFIVLLLHFGWYRRKINQKIVGLPASDLDPKFDYTNMRIGTGFLVIFFILLILAPFLLAMTQAWGVKGIIISLSLIFFVFIAYIIDMYFSVIKKKQTKDASNIN
ncbi:MAG: hypothetical protein ABFD82_16890 [Syntrophaceae bacterium]